MRTKIATRSNSHHMPTETQTNRKGALLTSAELKKWTRIRPGVMIGAIAGEYYCLMLLLVSSVYTIENLGAWSLPSWLVVPIGLFTITIAGCLMHRLCILGHEASHGMLFQNRKWNEVAAELLLFFPFWTTLASYREKHRGHHLHPNDPDKDPNLAHHKHEEHYSRFPMPRPRFIWTYYAKAFWPPFVLRNLAELCQVLSFGNLSGKGEGGKRTPLKSPTVLGILFLVALVNMTFVSRGNAAGLFTGQGVMLVLAAIGWRFLPASCYTSYHCPSPVSQKLMGLLRLYFFSGIFILFSWVRMKTGLNLGPYYLALWLIPNIYVLPYLVLLREIYQHANLGTGKLDNSRIIHVDPFTRWALLGYGNDFHLIHHIYPNIPYYHVRAVHDRLMSQSDLYRSSIEETDGVFRSRKDQSGIDHSLLTSLEENRAV